MPHSLLHTLVRGSQPSCNLVVFICLQVTRYAAAHGIKYVALSNYEGTIFGMFRAPHQLLLSNLIRFNDMTPSVLEVKNCCSGNAKQAATSGSPFLLCHIALQSICVTVHLSQWHVAMQCIHAITTWASSENMHQPWKPCKEHAPSERAVGDADNPRRHVPEDADDDSDHGAPHSKKKAISLASKQGKRKRGAAAESSTAGCSLPRGKKASLSLRSVFRISAIVPLLQQQWQEQKEGQHMLPDLGASAAAFCLADICGVVGKGASGRVFAARCA